VIALLRNAGGDVNAKQESGSTPLQLANQIGNRAAIEELSDLSK